MAHKPTPDLSRVRWRKSSYSGVDSNCVEIAFLDGFTLLRDSQGPLRPGSHLYPGRVVSLHRRRAGR